MNLPRIQFILGSTREGRRSDAVGKWVWSIARKRTDMEAEMIDLKEWDLPFFNNPASPGMGAKYDSDKIEKFSAKIAGADGYVIVVPEYNHGYPAVLKNAIDQLYFEWNNKPIAFVGYSGGASGAVRAIEQLRQVAIELQMAPIREEVNIPFVWKNFRDGKPAEEGMHTKKAEGMLDQLLWWANALKAARAAKKPSG